MLNSTQNLDDSMLGEFLFLGTGASMGVPLIGCHCPVCSSTDPKNRRLRPSGLIRFGQRQLVIDTGPDFRLQALNHQVDFLDGVIYTHTHFDHIAGIDELRLFYIRTQTPLPILLSRASYEDLKRRYEYLFREKSAGLSLAAQLEFHVLEELRGEMHFLGLPLRYLSYTQGGMQILGFRSGNFAYISDIREYPETLFEDLRGVETLVVSALRSLPSPMHFSLDEAINFARKIGAKQTYFTHISHEIEHNAINAQLPEGFALAFDGLKIYFEFENDNR